MLIVDKVPRKHPFKDEKAGWAWFDGLRRRLPSITIRSPQPLHTLKHYVPTRMLSTIFEDILELNLLNST